MIAIVIVLCIVLAWCAIPSPPAPKPEAEKPTVIVEHHHHHVTHVHNTYEVQMVVVAPPAAEASQTLSAPGPAQKALGSYRQHLLLTAPPKSKIEA